MKRTDSQNLKAELQELEMILKTIPEEHVIDRSSFEARRKKVLGLLDALTEEGFVNKAKLTFRGAPVVGTHGVLADFATKANGAFSDAFTAIIAGLEDTLKYMGPIPDKSKNQLLITGTAIGSFGFEYELPGSGTELFPQTLKPFDAFGLLLSVLQLSAEGSDDEIAEVIEEMHPRAVRKIRDFLEVLDQSNALCGIEFQDKLFRYKDKDQLKGSMDRLKDDNIHEDWVVFAGEFQGVLPQTRTFEFRLSDQAGIIKGKVDFSIQDPDVLNREWLHKPVTIKLHAIQVGMGRPRHSLKNLGDITILTR